MRPTAAELFGPAGTPRVVVVGAGIAGIATGVKLRKAGIETFTIYESSLGVGGTWWDNTYPGAEVDVGSHMYSYSFKSHDWTRTHAQQAELQKYLEETVDEFGLRSHLRLGVTARSATWDEARHVWALELEDETGATITDECHVLVSAVGFLNVPRYPDWPGLDTFQGPKMHTSRWDHSVDLTGKVVAVVGTGSTSTQLVPAIQPIVEKLYLFQREPGWVLPKGERDFSDEERQYYSRVWRRKVERYKQRVKMDQFIWGAKAFRPGTKLNKQVEEAARGYIAGVFADRPDLAAAVTPNHPYGGKRPIQASTFYPALKQPNVELIPKAVTSVTPTGIVDSDGVERAIDVLVMATGFQPANYLARLKVTGRAGKTLQETWAGEPRAFLGITVPGFPNFFMCYGPGTNGGELVNMLESQASYAVRAVKRMSRERVSAIEVRPAADERWQRWLQKQYEGTAWTMANNYYKAPSGSSKIVTQWPTACSVYWFHTKAFGRISETTRRRTS